MSYPVLRHKLTLETRQDTPDGAGGFAEGWLALGTHWASITASSANEIFSASRQRQRVTHRIIIRCVPVGSTARPRADQRFKKGGTAYNIRAVFDRDGKGRYLTCLCEEGAPA